MMADGQGENIMRVYSLRALCGGIKIHINIIKSSYNMDTQRQFIYALRALFS